MGKVKRLFKWFGATTLILAFLSLFGFGVTYVDSGGQLGSLTWPLKKFVSFPVTVYTVLTSSELLGVPPTFIKKDASFKNINNLNYDLWGLNSFFNMEQSRWEIKLLNFKDDSVFHTWQLTQDSFVQGKRKFKNAEPRNSILLPNRSLIANCDESTNLYKLDENSNILWHNTSKIFHHALNLGADSNIWICSSSLKKFRDDRKGGRFFYRDDCITKVSVESGQILFDKSVSELLIENGYSNFVFGFSNQVKPTEDKDPLHLNDIQPVLNNSAYWQKGDVFISLRHKSLVFLYRPETNKIIRMIYGPFINQHDVDIISDSEISLFDNHVTTIGSINQMKELGEAKPISDDFSSSEIIVYNFEDSTFRKILKHQFAQEKISSRTNGLFELLSTGDVFIESHDQGKVFIMNEDEIVFKQQRSTSIKYMIELPNWTRIYEHINF